MRHQWTNVLTDHWINQPTNLVVYRDRLRSPLGECKKATVNPRNCIAEIKKASGASIKQTIQAKEQAKEQAMQAKYGAVPVKSARCKQESCVEKVLQVKKHSPLEKMQSSWARKWLLRSRKQLLQARERAVWAKKQEVPASNENKTAKKLMQDEVKDHVLLKILLK